DHALVASAIAAVTLVTAIIAPIIPAAVILALVAPIVAARGGAAAFGHFDDDRFHHGLDLGLAILALTRRAGARGLAVPPLAATIGPRRGRTILAAFRHHEAFGQRAARDLLFHEVLDVRQVFLV